MNSRIDEGKLLTLENAKMHNALEWKAQIVQILGTQIQKLKVDLEKGQADLINSQLLVEDQNVEIERLKNQLKEWSLSKSTEIRPQKDQSVAHQPKTTQFWHNLEENETAKIKLAKDLESKNAYTNAMLKSRISDLQNLIEARKLEKQQKICLTEEQKKAKKACNVRNFFKAAYNGRINDVRKLIEDGINVNAKYCGGTALHAAATKGHSEIVKFLLQYEVKINAKNKFGLTALDIAEVEKHVKVAEILLKNGAKRGL